MSLSVLLLMEMQADRSVGSGIFVRENGEIKEISRADWDAKFPTLDPSELSAQPVKSEVFWRNITHNLGQMADAAGVYIALWRPEEAGYTKAAQLIEPLRAGLTTLQANPARFADLNPANGWGNYESLVQFIKAYLAACEAYPDADISISR